MSSLGLAPIQVIRSNLDRLYGPEWPSLEVETISMELGEVFDELTRDKISVLKALIADSNLFWEEPLFLLHACITLNNHVTSFDHIPMPTSLELIWATDQVTEMFGVPEVTADSYKMVAKEILVNDGYSQVPAQIPAIDGVLNEGQLPEDISAKTAAIKMYLIHMSKEGV